MNLKPSITLVLILAIFASQAEIYPQPVPSFPRLEPDAKILEYYNLGRRSGGYTWQNLAEIALYISADTALSNLERINTVVSNLNNSSELPASEKEKAEYILTFLHRNILRSYSLYQTRVDTALTNGSFNCVSSAVLYIILCKSAGIRTSGVITRDHAFVIVHIDGQDIDVETTTRFGFDPGNRREFHDQFGRLTGFTYVPAQNYRDRQTISNIELISLIMNNRIADMERRNNFAASVPIAIDRAALLFGESLETSEVHASGFIFADPRNDLMDRLMNFGVVLLRANREEDSLRWAEIASSRYPNIVRWQEYTSAAINNRISRFLRERNIIEAANFLENYKSLLNDASYAQLDSLIVDADILGRANRSSTAEESNSIINAILQARQDNRMNERRANELITFVIQRTAQAISAAPQRNWRAAIRYLEAAISRHGANRELEQALRTYQNNLATEYHNRFAAEWNRRNYDEAERILEEGLVEFPDNRQLLNNRETVNRFRARQ